jgi:hypothetical protein
MLVTVSINFQATSSFVDWYVKVNSAVLGMRRQFVQPSPVDAISPSIVIFQALLGVLMNIVRLFVERPDFDLAVVASSNDDLLAIEALVLVRSRSPNCMVDFKHIMCVLCHCHHYPLGYSSL